jgi:hypothetical protein
MGKETFMKVCNENIEQAITEKDWTTESYYAKEWNQTKNKSNKINSSETTKQ